MLRTMRGLGMKSIDWPIFIASVIRGVIAAGDWLRGRKMMVPGTSHSI
jgi:hypothetical protein